MIKHIRNISGLTLIETLVAVALVAVTAVMLVGAFVPSDATEMQAEIYEGSNQEIHAYIQDAERKNPQAVIEVKQEEILKFTFEGAQVEVRGKVVVLVSRHEKILEYRVFSKE